MNDSHNEQIERLKSAVSSAVNDGGADACASVETHSILLINWINYLSTFHRTGIANSLLQASGSSLRESAACFTLGLVRPALFSLRSVIDLVLAWLYFKDHPIEWQLVNDTGDGFLMKKDVLDYLYTHYRGVRKRVSLLAQIAQRKEKEPYRLLSAHIHGQSEMVLPTVEHLCDTVKLPRDTLDATGVCYDVSEYVSDLLISIYFRDWHAIPLSVTNSISSRFVSPAQRAEFWSY